MTRDQIGQALEYTDPSDAIKDIHARHNVRLDKFSDTRKLRATDGKLYDTIVYSAKGVYEICRHSEQPKADAFYDWTYEVLEDIRKHDESPGSTIAHNIWWSDMTRECFHIFNATRTASFPSNWAPF